MVNGDIVAWLLLLRLVFNVNLMVIVVNLVNLLDAKRGPHELRNLVRLVTSYLFHLQGVVAGRLQKFRSYTAQILNHEVLWLLLLKLLIHALGLGNVRLEVRARRALFKLFSL
jgi:hypothetical protein